VTRPVALRLPSQRRTTIDGDALDTLCVGGTRHTEEVTLSFVMRLTGHAQARTQSVHRSQLYPNR